MHFSENPLSIRRFCSVAHSKQTDGQTDRQTEFISAQGFFSTQIHRSAKLRAALQKRSAISLEFGPIYSPIVVAVI